MRRTLIVKRVRAIARSKGVSVLLVEGRHHTKVLFDGQRVTTIPRHAEVAEGTAHSIIKTAEKWER
jgi:hypothetical protein